MKCLPQFFFALTATLWPISGCSGSEFSPDGEPARTNGTAQGQVFDRNLYPAKEFVVLSQTDFARTHYHLRISEFRNAPLQHGQVVMPGDSHVQGFDWDSALPSGILTRNRDVSGDTSDGLLYRLDEIIDSEPSHVFLLVGTNDLCSDHSSGEIAASIRNAVRNILDASPKTKIYVHTIFPLRDPPALNAKAIRTNRLLVDQAAQVPYGVIDLWPILSDEQGSLREDLTDDGVHLNQARYRIWAEHLSQILTPNLR